MVSPNRTDASLDQQIEDISVTSPSTEHIPRTNDLIDPSVPVDRVQDRLESDEIPMDVGEKSDTHWWPG